MQIGDTVKVFSGMSEYDGQTGRIVLIASAPGAPAPYVVQFGDAITEPFSERELVSLKPIESLWLSAPFETSHAPHGLSQPARAYIGRIIANRFMDGERRRFSRSVVAHGIGYIHGLVKAPEETDSQFKQRVSLRLGLGSPCVQCGKPCCSHR